MENFSLCVLQKHNCMCNSADIPTLPDPAPMTRFRGEAVTHDIAQDLFMGWLGKEAYSWKVVRACLFIGNTIFYGSTTNMPKNEANFGGAVLRGFEAAVGGSCKKLIAVICGGQGTNLFCGACELKRGLADVLRSHDFGAAGGLLCPENVWGKGGSPAPQS